MDDPLEQGLQLPADEEEEEAAEAVNFGGEDVKRIGKEDEERRDEVRRIVDPRKPTQKEVDEHELYHLPFRNWCPSCVKAKGKELDHRKSLEETERIFRILFRLCFPG